ERAEVQLGNDVVVRDDGAARVARDDRREVGRGEFVWEHDGRHLAADELRANDVDGVDVAEIEVGRLGAVRVPVGPPADHHVGRERQELGIAHVWIDLAESEHGDVFHRHRRARRAIDRPGAGVDLYVPRRPFVRATGAGAAADAAAAAPGLNEG